MLERDHRRNMGKLCRACERHAADHGGVCNFCRRRILRDPIVPAMPSRVWKVAALLTGLLAVSSMLIAAVVMTRRSPVGRLAPAKPAVITMVAEQRTRNVYPYSIVPGGALELDEARQAMTDPAVIANFAGFDFAKLRQVKLGRDLVGYVSYRLGEKTYWTSKTVTLRVGETVFTDGVNLVRGRCLNGYSPIAMQPIGPDEPAEEVLDTPVEMPVIAYSLPQLSMEPPELPPTPEELTPTVPISPTAPGSGLWYPLVPIVPPIHRRPATAAPPAGAP